jgi:hypothetical protein
MKIEKSQTGNGSGFLVVRRAAPGAFRQAPPHRGDVGFSRPDIFYIAAL